MDSHVAFDVVASGLEEVRHLEVGLRRVHLGLHLTVGVVDDGQEHVLEVSKHSIQQRKGKWKAKENLETSFLFLPKRSGEAKMKEQTEGIVRLVTIRFKLFFNQ